MVQVNELLNALKERRAGSTLQVIFFFLQHPQNKFYKEELLRKINLSKATIYNCVDLLQKQEFILKEELGRMIFYRLNKSHPIIKELKILLSTSLLLPVLPKLENCEIYIFGSIARGEDDEESDIDMLFIGRLNKNEIINLCEEMSNKIKKEIKPVIYTEQEFAKLASGDKAFYEMLLRDRKKVWPWI